MGHHLKTFVIATAAVLGTGVLGNSNASAARNHFYRRNGNQFKNVVSFHTSHVTRFRHTTVVDRHGCKRRIRVPYRVCKRIETCRIYCRAPRYNRVRRCFTKRVRVIGKCGCAKYVIRRYHRWVNVRAGYKWVFVRTTVRTRFV